MKVNSIVVVFHILQVVLNDHVVAPGRRKLGHRLLRFLRDHLVLKGVLFLNLFVVISKILKRAATISMRPTTTPSIVCSQLIQLHLYLFITFAGHVGDVDALHLVNGGWRHHDKETPLLVVRRILNQHLRFKQFLYHCFN